MTIAKSYDTPGWSADKAQNEMQQAITALGNNGFNGVLAANDDLAGGAIAAMKSAGIKPSTRPTTGQDATVAGLQRILIGEQYMTVYKAVKPEAGAAAQIAVALVKGDDVPSGLDQPADRQRPEEGAVGDPDAGGDHSRATSRPSSRAAT